MDSIDPVNINRTLHPLFDLREGQVARIELIDPDTPLAERFGDLGLHTGTRLRFVRVGFLGDPTAYGVEGTDTVLAIRKQDAAAIYISLEERRGQGGNGTWA